MNATGDHPADADWEDAEVSKLDASRLLLRVYVEVPSVQAALTTATELLKGLNLPLRVLSCVVKPYFKTPEYQGLTIHFRCREPERDFQILRQSFAPQWHDYPNLDAVWDIREHGEHGPAVHPAARWAQVQVLYDADLPPEL